jgi:G:T/U-mismatch repair DNA glycosylase
MAVKVAAAPAAVFKNSRRVPICIILSIQSESCSDSSDKTKGHYAPRIQQMQISSSADIAMVGFKMKIPV